MKSATNEPPRFYLISLGCPKNLVDSVGMTILLERAGYRLAEDVSDADVLIVNTCGFIEPARQESLDVLHELAEQRSAGQRLIAAGCYAQRSPEELYQAVPGLDGVIGTRRWREISDLVAQFFPPPSGPREMMGGRMYVPRVARQGASAYIKLADGCRRACAFCAIPLIKGTAVSRPPEDILADARQLAAQGVLELVLIAQDTSDYGHDLGKKDGLAVLLEELVAAVPQVPWIRLMYTYPARITDRLIETMARHPQILPYLDLPLQHAHPAVLRRMRRPANVEAVIQVIERLRQAMPEIAIRTTFLVGFPGETEKEFQTLLQFVETMAFDRVGVFTYSHEAGTPAAVMGMEDDVPLDVKEDRRKRLMAIQQSISLEKNRALVGRKMDVLIEGYAEGISVGRSYRDAPEIDGLVLVEAQQPLGAIVPVRITTALEYDLVGRPAR